MDLLKTKSSSLPLSLSEEVEKLLLREIEKHENFVFSSVKGDYGETISSFFQYAILINVPKDIRIERVKSRAEDTVEKWIQSLECPIIRIDGTKPIEENINLELS